MRLTHSPQRRKITFHLTPFIAEWTYLFYLFSVWQSLCVWNFFLSVVLLLFVLSIDLKCKKRFDRNNRNNVTSAWMNYFILLVQENCCHQRYTCIYFRYFEDFYIRLILIEYPVCVFIRVDNTYHIQNEVNSLFIYVSLLTHSPNEHWLYLEFSILTESLTDDF